MDTVVFQASTLSPQKESVQLLFDTVSKRFTDIRVVVCNAGVCMTGRSLGRKLLMVAFDGMSGRNRSSQVF